MKLKRTRKDYGGGTGKEIFESALFRVVLWKLSKGTRTTISCNLMPISEIDFDGKQDFDSDVKCMEQYSIKEILRMIKYQKEISFADGQKSKINEIRRTFSLNEI